jgi:hypothetical protein
MTARGAPAIASGIDNGIGAGLDGPPDVTDAELSHLGGTDRFGDAPKEGRSAEVMVRSSSGVNIRLAGSAAIQQAPTTPVSVGSAGSSNALVGVSAEVRSHKVVPQASPGTPHVPGAVNISRIVDH